MVTPPQWAGPVHVSCGRALSVAVDTGPAGPEGSRPVLPTRASSCYPTDVERLVNATGLIGLAGRQHPVGIHFAGRRVTVRIDRGLLQVADHGIPLRSLPNPLTPAECGRIRDARPAGPPPVPATEPPRVDRRVSSRGALVVAGQRIQADIHLAGGHETDLWASPRDVDTGLCRDLMQRSRREGLFVVGVPAVGTSSPDGS